MAHSDEETLNNDEEFIEKSDEKLDDDNVFDENDDLQELDF